VKTFSIAYGRGLSGRLVVLNDLTTLIDQRDELDLLKQILTRHFRHNIRNEVSVIEGYASELHDIGDDAVQEMADVVQTRAAHLLREAEKARELERVFSAQSMVTVSLADLISRVLEPYQDCPDIEARSSVEDVEVVVHPQFSVAIEELVENAIAHDDGDGPVRVTIRSRVADDTVVLDVEDDGPGIPQTEIDVLETYEETPLKHSAGLGLWLVKLVVSRQNGSLNIDADADGSRVEITLHRALETAPTA
jgi:signal transduction histidine kinase